MSAPSKATPGPWRIGFFAVFAGRETAIANFDARGLEWPDILERAANARLIAAAPELRDALADILNWRTNLVRAFDSMPDSGVAIRESFDRSEALLARLDGEATP